jgi:ADP-ribosylation factor GTPase-activating protein 2/3
MKVGGNDSATKYFQSHGGSAALASKDPKTKYTSTAATKYKEELARRVVADKKLYPNEVTVTDVDEFASGSQTPTGEPEDDFFSSWDKPTIKRPSNPPSRTATPPVISRTSSPFLSAGANGNGTARPKSPLNADATSNASSSRPTSSAAIRKTTSTAAGARKPNILGAKKKGLGAKKVTQDVGLDFEEAERKAKEEAERIAKLGYNPDEETPAAPASKATVADDKIVSPTPLSPSRGSFGTTNKPRETSNSEMERLGMGIGRLGFGQTAGAKPQPKKMGFGSVGRAVQEEGMHSLPLTLSTNH